MSLGDYVLKVEGINKSFGPTHANKNVSLSLKRGEVRGLAGENGSGKSTLMSIVAGIQIKDSGEMYKDEEKYDPANPVDANKRKIGIVVQELGLVNNLPVGVNIFLGRTNEFNKCGVVDLEKLFEAAKEQLKKWNLGDIPVKSSAGELSVECKKLIELARALSIDPDILILDEVTAALSQDKRIILYDIIADFKKQGKSVVIIAHDLEEIIKLTDSVTIMRDGEVVDTKDSSNLTPDILKRMMVGREINGAYYREDSEEQYDEEVVLEVKDLYAKDAFEDVSFELHKGEILGVCGLSGSGIHTLGKVIFGAIKPIKGHVFLKKQKEYIKNATQAIKMGFAYVPKDRDGEALMLNASIRDNMCLPSIKDILGFIGFINPLKLKKLSEKAVSTYEVKTTGITQFIGRLSGGNKQKVNLARWMIRDIDVIILDCPTRGVDVGVKSYIYSMMNEAKQKGLSIILISDELPEVLGMSDRILVMKNGKSAGIFNRSSHFTEDSIIEVMI